jgi:hypothetical protein
VLSMSRPLQCFMKWCSGTSVVTCARPMMATCGRQGRGAAAGCACVRACVHACGGAQAHWPQGRRGARCRAHTRCRPSAVQALLGPTRHCASRSRCSTAGGEA